MATSFTSLPIVDLSALSDPGFDAAGPQGRVLAQQLYDVFATSGFAYLTHAPLSFSHDEVFGLSKQFFGLSDAEKWKMAKKTFVQTNDNTYRGYFPTQPLQALDNLKEGFEMGSGKVKTTPTPANLARFSSAVSSFNLYEPNIWPAPSAQFPSAARKRLTQFYRELQTLSANLLALLAISLGKPADYFASWLDDSLSTLRLLHYPSARPIHRDGMDDDDDDDVSSIASMDTLSSADTTLSSEPDSIFSSPDEQRTTAIRAKDALAKPAPVKLSCTPHTDSGILTLLHQDPTGGLEVLNSAGDWIAAPYVPGSIVVNIGDLMAKVSGGRFVATMHRVRAPAAKKGGDGFGRFSVPFFFEPGEDCVVKTIEADGNEGEGVRYGVHVREKMSTWVEFQDADGRAAK